jgi:hypothetical protein
MRCDLSVPFLNGPATAVLQYLQAPTLKDIAGGKFLHDILLAIVEPPIFWTKFIHGFRCGELQENAQLAFAWLLLQLISLPGEKATPYREIAEDPKILDAILASSHFDTRATGQKIKHILATSNSGEAIDSAYAPGGRHDNDFVDFRKITILPTADEISSTEFPFLRTSVYLEDLETEETRQATYLDNQFRLLREDMVNDLREELQIALGKKKRAHRGFVIDGMRLLDVYCGPENKRCKWGLAFRCNDDFWQFKKDKPKDRKAYLTDSHNRRILKHQSLSCLLADDEVIAFPTVNREENLLAQKPPVVILQLEGESSTIAALLKLKTAKHIKLIQIDTAVFSYEPILKALQSTRNILLADELLFWKNEQSVLRSPTSQPIAVIQAIRRDPRMDLKSLLYTSKSIVLDKSQISSLLAGLTQNVSLIQGPPGAPLEIFPEYTMPSDC